MINLFMINLFIAYERVGFFETNEQPTTRRSNFQPL